MSAVGCQVLVIRATVAYRGDVRERMMETRGQMVMVVVPDIMNLEHLLTSHLIGKLTYEPFSLSTFSALYEASLHLL